jgi:hypothetical protein
MDITKYVNDDELLNHIMIKYFGVDLNHQIVDSYLVDKLKLDRILL